MPAHRVVPELSCCRILITGASGGLGAAIARQYAAPGRTLLLWGRNLDQLSVVASACRDAGANVTVRALDLTDSKAAIAAAEDEDGSSPITLAIFAAGLGDVRAAGDLVEAASLVATLGLVNFVAPCAMAAALAARMAARGHGRIILVGSAAAFHNLPFAPAYAGSKAGLARFAQALRIGVARYGVTVTLVSPGFIDTAAGRKVAGPKPFLMQPAAVAARIATAAERGVPHLILPWPFALTRVVDRLLPRRMRDRLMLALSPGTD